MLTCRRYLYTLFVPCNLGLETVVLGFLLRFISITKISHPGKSNLRVKELFWLPIMARKTNNRNLDQLFTLHPQSGSSECWKPWMQVLVPNSEHQCFHSNNSPLYTAYNLSPGNVSLTVTGYIFSPKLKHSRKSPPGMCWDISLLSTWHIACHFKS